MSSSVLSLGEVSIYAHTFPLWSAEPVPGGDLKRHGKTAIFSSQDTVHPCCTGQAEISTDRVGTPQILWMSFIVIWKCAGGIRNNYTALIYKTNTYVCVFFYRIFMSHTRQNKHQHRTNAALTGRVHCFSLKKRKNTS